LLTFGLVGWIRSLGRPRWRTEVLRSASGSRLPYAIALPRRRPTTHTVPLVLALHGDWDRGQRPSHGLGKKFLAERVYPGLRGLEAIMVAPDCPGDGWTEPKIERTLLGLMGALRKRYPVTPGRSVVVGYGLGGEGAWFMLARHPEFFSAAIPVAAQPEGLWVEGIRNGAVCAIQDRADELVPLEPTQKAIARLRERGLPAELLVVDAPWHSDPRRFYLPLRRSAGWLQGAWRRRRNQTV